MASSSSPPSSAISPSSSSSSSPPPPSSSLSPLPSTSQSPNDTAEPPASLNSPPPLPSTSPPPTSPPPTSLPPTSLPVSPPPSSTLTPPPQADPPSVSPPSPSIPTLPPPTSPTPSPPSPSIPTLPPPTPPNSSPPPPTSRNSSPPPPTSRNSSPPPPQPTSRNSSPPPPSIPPPTPPTSSPPSLPSPTPPKSSSPPPPLVDPPVPSPPAPVSVSSPPPRSQIPPPTPSAPPPNKQPPSALSPPSPPSNSSNGTPPLTNSPPLPSPNTPTTPISPTGNKSSTSGPNITAGIGNVGDDGGGGKNNGVVLPVSIVTSILVLSLVGLAVWYFRKRKRRASGYEAGFVMPSPLTSSQMSESSYPRSPGAPLMYNSSGGHGFINSPPDPGLGNSKSWFSYEELYKVTNGFSEQNLLGEGGFGCVYKGCLPDGREVAIKQLKVGGSQGEREFTAEVEIIGRVHHRHLVSLVGYCISDHQRLLVYEYVPNNTLHYHLHAEGRPVMDWAVRVKVAAGAARGIAYLHEDCHPRIIHRDIKSSNILLDNNYEAQVADFGLAKLAMDAVTHVTTRVMGTFGYMAPEYASSGKLTERSDVYSFGVVLLELITGRKPVDTSQPLGDESLVEWARPLLTHALETGYFDSLSDPRLENNYNEREMFRMMETAAACIRHSAPMRPRMGLVVRALEGLADVDVTNGVKPGQSELFSVNSSEIRLFHRMAFGSQEYSSDFSKASRNSLGGSG